ncbi:HlyD family efflux transporter periplasmic adaptor subunit [Planococcus shenhongbingii]|uniref:efflux RND transporter periplasmic adaptor subunit n=1 Tax=Planococcus shenhongbingii TaxID=3058398 RepID=UPI00261AEBE1|nr:HlyD family efflux transporter periplasmic adaptor subunit [Planococcus sp. N016]WKA56994.1 HlyD family efflux transporter periplasmic adaptor subunit [Planococcus sp. N016]
MNAKSKRKKRKWLLWSIIGILVIAMPATAIFMPKGTGAFQEEVAETGDIRTFYNFPGTVDAKNRESVISEKPMQVCDIKVQQGDQVKSGDVLMVTITGEEIKAPIEGEVSQILIKKNMQVPAGIEMMKIVDYVNFETNVKVDEYSFKFLEADQKVNVTINALGKELTGTISDISKEAISENGVSYFIVAIDLSNDEGLRIGMSTEAKIVKEEAIAVTTLPMEVILFDNDNEPYVLLPAEEGEPVKQAITTGINDGMIVEVTSGVSAGDSVMHSTGEEGLLEQLFWR